MERQRKILAERAYNNQNYRDQLNRYRDLAAKILKR